MSVVAYRHIKWGLDSKLLTRILSWRPCNPGTLKLNSILCLFKCEPRDLQLPERFWPIPTPLSQTLKESLDNELHQLSLCCPFSQATQDQLGKEAKNSSSSPPLHCYILNYHFNALGTCKGSNAARKRIFNTCALIKRTFNWVHIICCFKVTQWKITPISCY